MENFLSLIVAFFIQTDKANEEFNIDLNFWWNRGDTVCELDISSRTDSGVTILSNCEIF